MSKNHRGSGLRAQPAHGRGTCPVCHKEDIKIIYDQEIDGKKVKVCKYCNANLKNKAMKDKKTAAPAAPVAAETAAAPEANANA